MNKAPLHDGRRGADYVKKAAARYVERFPEADRLALEVSHAINACYNAKRAALARMYDGLGYGRAVGRSTLLHVLFFARSQPLSHSEIGNELQITPGSVTYLVDGLEKEGLVRRVVDPANRRTVYVELTEEGQQVAATLTPSIVDYADKISEGLTDSEKQTLVDLTLRCLDNALKAYVYEAGTARV